jgi:hypothetical protein
MFHSRNPERALPAYPTPVRAQSSFGWNLSRELSARRGSRSTSPSERVSRFHDLDAELRDFLVKDDEGFLGVVDEIRADGTVLVARGWFGRRHLILRLEEIQEIRLAERVLVLRSGGPAVEEIRAAGGSFARLLTKLVGRSLAGRSDAQTTRRSR